MVRRFGVFNALRDRVAEDETLKNRADWFGPIISIIKTKIDSKTNNSELAKEGHMWLTQVSDTSVGHLCRTPVSDTNGYRAIELPAKDLLSKDLIAKDLKNIGFTPKARTRAAVALESFLFRYKASTGRDHPGISPSEKQKIIGEVEQIFATFDEVVDAKPEFAIQATIKKFFEDWKVGNLKAEDPTIWLFVDPKVWRMRAFRAGVIDTESVFDPVDGSVLEEER